VRPYRGGGHRSFSQHPTQPPFWSLKTSSFASVFSCNVADIRGSMTFVFWLNFRFVVHKYCWMSLRFPFFLFFSPFDRDEDRPRRCVLIVLVFFSINLQLLQWRRYIRGRQVKLAPGSNPGSALPSPAYGFAVTITVTEALVLRPLLEDRGRITESIRILVPVDRMKQKCFRITTTLVRRSQQSQLR